MHILSIELEDVPLQVELGLEIAPVNCEAEISYDSEGNWLVGSIYMEGVKHLTKAQSWENFVAMSRGEKRPHEIVHKRVKLEPTEFFYLAILDQIENGRFHSQVENAVLKQIEEHGFSFKTEHDHQRSEFMAGVM